MASKNRSMDEMTKSSNRTSRTIVICNVKHSHTDENVTQTYTGPNSRRLSSDTGEPQHLAPFYVEQLFFFEFVFLQKLMKVFAADVEVAFD